MTIIFDLDGTLLNTIDDLGYACNYALEQTGYATHSIADYPRMVGNGINNLIRRALPLDQQTEENILRVRAYFVPYYLRLYASVWRDTRIVSDAQIAGPSPGCGKQ